MNEDLKKQGFITVEHIRNGKTIKKFNFKNIITNAGIAEFTKLAGNGLGGTPAGYIALGTGLTAVAATDTTLEGEISTNNLGRAAATVSVQTTTVTGDTTQLYHSFTASGISAVAKVGIFNAASTGTLFCEQLFPGIVTTANGDLLAITYQIKNS